MSCRGDCCKRVATLEAQAGLIRLERTIVRGGIEELIVDLQGLKREEVLARLEAILSRLPAAP